MRSLVEALYGVGSQPSSCGASSRSYYIGRPVSAVNLLLPERPVAPII